MHPDSNHSTLSRNTRLLLVDLGSHYGGVEIYLDGLSDILRDKVSLYSICSLPKLASQLTGKGAKVICIPILRNKWCKALRLLITAIILPWVLLFHRIQIVQLNGYFESMLLPMIRLLGITAVYTMHGPFETEQYVWYRNPERFFPRLVSRFCLSFASRIVCVSEAVGQVARQVLSPRKLRVIPNWVSSSLASASRSYTSHTPVKLLCAGRLEKYKGMQLVINILRELPGTSLIIAGDGSYKEELQLLSSGLPVEFAGFLSDLSEHYRTCDIFINPTLGPEGLPLVSIEAMGHGIPCIFSDIPVHVEITDNGAAASLFTSGDEASLLGAVRELRNSIEKRVQQADVALKVVDKRYSRAAATTQYLEVFGLN